MGFEAWDAARYRGADSDALEARKSEILAEADSAESKVDAELLAGEARACEAEYERRAAYAGLRSRLATEAMNPSAPVIASRKAEPPVDAEERAESPTDTVEYRKAFRDYVMGRRLTDAQSAMVAEVRADANTLTGDVGAVIPKMLVNRILETAETIGMILPLITKTSYPCGIEIPVGTMKPVATWVSEGAGSDKQKYSLNDKIVFTNHKLRCEVSISMEVSALTLSAFESKIVESIARAITVAKENAILNGSGSGQPKGILTETPNAGQALTVTKLDYKLLCDAEAALPQAYETAAKWFMSKKTFYGFIGMTDTNGQPVARIDHGISGKADRTLLGREVVLTGDYMPNFEESPSKNTLFAFLFNPADYTMNSIYDMGISKKQDWDTEDLLTKAVTSCDGKVIDKNSLVTLTVNKKVTA